jgi:transposase
MDPRHERGLIIAAMCKLNHADGAWLVPSQTAAERIYRVNPAAKTCTCPDHQDAGHKCKHIWAVEITMQRELFTDGTVVETRSVTLTERKTYKQNWPAYNLAQTTEKHRFQILLHDLCKGLPEVPAPKRGRHPHLVSDSIFSLTYKVYSMFSSRRFHSDLQDAHEQGYLCNPVPGLKVNQFLENPAFTPILGSLIARAAMPLRAIESDFAIDSSGFSSSKFIRWYDEKYGITRQKHAWVKVHLVCGVKTNVVTAVRILEKDSGDCPQLAPLVAQTAENFAIREFSADKAYLSHENFGLIDQLGGTLYVPFKSNSTPGESGSLWEKMYGYYTFRLAEFLQHYHKRSNVESTFSAIKRKFGDSVRSKKDVAMVNEVLAKLLCHNLTCVIHSQTELGIEPVFWQDRPEGIDRAVLPLIRNQPG